MRVSVVGSLLFRFTAYLSPSSPPSHQVRASVPPSTARCWWCDSSISPYPSTMWQAICNIPNGVTLRYLPFCTYFSTKKNGRSYWYIRKIVYFCKKNTSDPQLSLSSVLLASTRPPITESSDKLRQKHPLLPTTSPLSHNATWGNAQYLYFKIWRKIRNFITDYQSVRFYKVPFACF